MVPERTIERLSLYRRLLLNVRAEGHSIIVSRELAHLAHVTPAQVRRDIMQLGYSGTPNAGYVVADLVESIGDFLFGPVYQKAALVGVGNLGKAILTHFSGRWRRLSIRAVFDHDRSKIGQTFSGCRCYGMAALSETVREQGITLGVITVPGPSAQAVTDLLCNAGVAGVLNFAPVRVHAPGGVYVEHVDLTSTLEKVAFFARRGTVKAEASNG